MAASPTLFTSQDPRYCVIGKSLATPESGHPFGFDLQGCDYYARTIHGARTSLLIGLTVVTASAAIGLVLGSVAGYAGGVIDGFVSGAADLWMSMPIVLGGMFLLSFIENRGLLQVILVLTLFAWPAMVRLTRSSVMQTKGSEFVLAARALGASRTRVLTRHIIPHSLRPVVVYSALFAGTAIAAEAILSYMGVGLQLPAISWGLMLSGIRYRLPGHAHLLIPGVFLTCVVLGLILLADALRDATDPQVR
jgi:ABC-type dipeptide/oligopeptide/nickel transport system permease subunit